MGPQDEKNSLAPARVEPGAAPAPGPAGPGYGYGYGYGYGHGEAMGAGGTFADALQSRTFQDYLQALRQRKWLLAGLAAAGLAIGLAVVLPKPLTYGSVLTVEIQGINENFMGLAQVDPQASGGIYSATAANILTQVEILNSSSLKQRAAERLERESIPALPPQGSGLARVFNALRSAAGLGPSSPVEATREAIRAAVASARAQAVEGTRIVRVTCESTQPEIAAEFLNVLVAEYQEQALESRARSSKTTNQWLESQMKEQKQKLEEAETRLKDFIARSGLEGVTPQEQQGLTLADAKMLTLQRELAQIQTDRIVRQSRYETALKSGPENLPEGIASSALMQLRGQLIELEKQYAELTTTFTENHPRVVRLKAQMAELRKAIEKEREEIIERLKTDLEAARRREQLLLGSFAAQTGQVRGQADKTLQYNLLKREVESARQIYNTILQQVNQAGIATAVPTQNVRIVDAATPSGTANLRNVYLGSGLGVAMGLLFGAVLAVLLYHGEMKFYKPGEPTAVLQLPELGVIPSGELFHPGGGRLRPGRREGGGLAGYLKGAGNNGDQPAEVEVIAHGERPTLLAESFRAVLTSLLFSAESEKCRVVTVTSPNPQDGKSTVAANLALALAEMGRRVLLVDADLRKPRQHVLFNLENTWGLADLLEDETAVSAYPREAFYRETEVPNLYVLPSGPPLKNVGAMVHSDRFGELLQRFRQEFDYVFLDTPPVLVVSDARVTGQRSDGVILVLRAGETRQADALQVVRRLKEDGTRILGTVLNQWIPPRAGRKYYKKYYDYYRATEA
jgi:capsular exopolysaccharide synthesis family protein